MDNFAWPSRGARSHTRYTNAYDPLEEMEAPLEPRRPSTKPLTIVRGAVDAPLLWTTVILAIFGLVAVFTASAKMDILAYVLRQSVAISVGLAAMGLCSRISFKFWRRAGYPLAFLSIFLLLLTMLIGTTANGSERWLVIGGLQIQPSEFAKLAVIILMAHAVSQRRLNSGVLWINLALIGVMVALIFKQPNLSVSILLGILTGAMLFLGGMKKTFFLLGLPAVAYGVWQKILETPYQLRRIEGWLDPWGDPRDTGYNLIQSLYAIGLGGVFGRGLGNSLQKLNYLPFQHTDFIFAVICEELGLWGSLLVLGLYTVIGWRGFTITSRCASPFGRMLAFGLTAALLLQAAINISVTTGLMPVTGVTLPLISYGGTSAFITLVMIGILLNISRYRLAEEPMPTVDAGYYRP
jgi:cell division protein FtsW